MQQPSPRPPTLPKDIPETSSKEDVSAESIPEGSPPGPAYNPMYYSTRLPPRRHLPTYKHELNCRCIQCFMSREHAEIQAAERRLSRIAEQDYTGSSDASSSISSSPRGTPVLIFDLSDMDEPEEPNNCGSRNRDNRAVDSPPLAEPTPRAASAPPVILDSDRQPCCCTCADDDHQCQKSTKPAGQDDGGDSDDEESQRWADKDYSSASPSVAGSDSPRSMSPSDDMMMSSSADSDEEGAYDGDSSEKSAEVAAFENNMEMMKSKEGHYVIMHKKAIREIESRSPDGNIDDKYSAEQLVELLRLSGYRVIERFGHPYYTSSSGASSSGHGTPPLVYDSSPPRPGTLTPYVPMPNALGDGSVAAAEEELVRLPSSSSVSAPIFVPQLYSLKRPGSPDLPPVPENRNDATFRELAVKLESVRGMEGSMSPASSPRPHHTRAYGSAIVDPKAFNVAFHTNPVLTARISPMLRAALFNSINRSRSQDVLNSDRNKASVALRNERANFVVKTGLDQAVPAAKQTGIVVTV